MENEKITSVKDIPDVLGISKGNAIAALNILRKEKYSRDIICDALNHNILFIRHMKKKMPVVGLIIETVRRQVRMKRNALDWEKPSGNPVRDRILEVGKYNPFDSNYVGDIIKNRQSIWSKRSYRGEGL